MKTTTISGGTESSNCLIVTGHKVDIKKAVPQCRKNGFVGRIEFKTDNRKIVVDEKDKIIYDSSDVFYDWFDDLEKSLAAN